MSANILALQERFLGINLEKELIRRAMRNARDEGKLSRDTNMGKLVNCGTSPLSRGGTFELYLSKVITRPTVQGLAFKDHL
eukprot:snap_masked-scaffold_72-processed-gene-0.30-mRNA-1 protein AED:1.00 eAED:1.00 QI:0/-1/0/0/-1/1/1/0/80